MPRSRVRQTDPLTRARNQFEILGAPGFGGLSRAGGVLQAGTLVSVGLPQSAGGGQTRIEHVTLEAASQTIANGGGDVSWSEVSTPPLEQRGFVNLSVPVTDVQVDVTGVVLLTVELTYSSYASGGTVTVTRTRDGDTEVLSLSSGPSASRFFWAADVAVEVEAGDTLTVGVPNSSGGNVTLSSGRLQVTVIELAQVTDAVAAETQAPQDDLLVWWRADTIDGSDGDTVSTWTNEGSTGSSHDGTATGTPELKTGILNGKPVVRYTSADSDGHYTGSTAISGNFSIYVVYDWRSGNSGPNTLFRGLTTDDLYTRLITGGGTHRTSDGTAQIDESTDSAARQDSFIRSGTTLTWRKGGSSVGSDTMSSAAAIEGFSVAHRRVGGAGEFSNVDVAELLIYDVAHTTSEREEVEAYLTNKYGV